MVEYNCAKFQNCTIKTFWVIALQRKCWRTDRRRTDGRTEPRIYTLLPLIVEYNCVKFQNCTIKPFCVIASHVELSHHNENIDGQTNGWADRTQNLYTSASYGRVQLCKVSKLYDKSFLSYRITMKMLTDRRTDNVITIGHPHFMLGPNYIALDWKQIGLNIWTTLNSHHPRIICTILAQWVCRGRFLAGYHSVSLSLSLCLRWANNNSNF